MRTKRASYSRKRVPSSSSSCVSEFFLVRSKPHLFFFFLGNQGRELYLGRDHEFFEKKVDLKK